MSMQNYLLPISILPLRGHDDPLRDIGGDVVRMIVGEIFAAPLHSRMHWPAVSINQFSAITPPSPPLMASTHHLA